jgi:Tol biopolymer transport system component
VAYIYFPGKDPRYSATRVAMMPWNGDGGFRVLEASPSDETEFSWSPDGQALDFSVNNAGVGNVWRQPASGGPPLRLTNFAADELFAFAWSRDGRLALARGATTRSVILIENLR